MQPFARRLKEARQERGMSQTDLGGERYSGSYISHLEKGRRAPTPEVVDYLASRLGVAPTTLVGRQEGATASGSGTPDLAIAALDARSAWESRDHFNAIGLADVARKAAVKEARPEAWWAATHLKAQALLALEAAGVPGGRIYPGSWSDWITDPDRPVATGSEPGRR